jgi:hypothetical protein
MSLWQRLKCALLAGLAGWITGWLAGWPFEFATAWRYVDAKAALLPEALTKGLTVWLAFSGVMSAVGFFPLVLPLLLLVPPTWIVRWRWVLLPLAPLLAMAAIARRMGYLHRWIVHEPEAYGAFFFTAPNFFTIGFGLGLIWTYVWLAKRRLS